MSHVCYNGRLSTIMFFPFQDYTVNYLPAFFLRGGGGEGGGEPFKVSGFLEDSLILNKLIHGISGKK